MDSHFIFINNKLEELTNNPVLRFDPNYIDEITEKIEIIESSLNDMNDNLNNLKKLSKLTKVDINIQLLNNNFKKFTLQKEEYETIIFNKNIKLKDITKEDDINLVSLKEITNKIDKINNEIEKNIKMKNTIVIKPKIIISQKRPSYLELRNNKKLEKKYKTKNLEKLEKYKHQLNIEKNQLKSIYENEIKQLNDTISILSNNNFTNLEDKIKNSKKIKDLKDNIKKNNNNFVSKINQFNSLINETENKIDELSKIHITNKVEDVSKNNENTETDIEINYDQIINNLKSEREDLIKTKKKTA